jgi:hypothetical protein
MSENRVLRRIFGPMRDEIIGGWRKLYNEEFHNLYSSPNTFITRTIKSMRWAGDVAHMSEKTDAYRVLVWKPLTLYIVLFITVTFPHPDCIWIYGNKDDDEAKRRIGRI